MIKHWEKIVFALLVVAWVAVALTYAPQLGKVDKLKSDAALASGELKSLLDNMKPPPVDRVERGSVREPITKRWRSGAGARILSPAILGEPPRKEQ